MSEIRLTVDTAELSKLSLKPGEVLLVRCGAIETAEEARYLQDGIKAFLMDYGIDNGVLVLPPDTTLDILAEMPVDYSSWGVGWCSTHQAYAGPDDPNWPGCCRRSESAANCIFPNGVPSP